MNEDIESAKMNQRKVGAAEDNPETLGPAENLRDEAAEITDENQDEKEPAQLKVDSTILFIVAEEKVLLNPLNKDLEYSIT